MSSVSPAPAFDPRQDPGFSHEIARFFDATSDAIIFLDRNYNCLFVNRRAREILGSYAPALGANLFEAMPSLDIPGSNHRENYRRSMDLGEATEFEAYCEEPLKLWFRIQSYPTSSGIMILFRDISHERSAAEELLQKTRETERQHAELETIYRTAPIGLALFDLKDYRYLRLNDRQAAFFGLKPEQIVGRTLTEMAPIDGLRELFDQVVAGHPVVNFPLEGRLVNDPPDEHRYWTVSYFPVYGADGKIQAITAASLEITKQKKAEQALVRSEKLAVVGRLASSIAHEINNPLEAVTNLIYLARNASSLEEVHKHLDSAETELRRVAAITNQTLRFHKQASNPRAVSPEELLNSVLSVARGRIANSEVTIEKSLRAERPILCFEGEIRQVLSNLINNSLDALGAGAGRLIIRTRYTHNWTTGEPGIAITIADTGTGMNRETLGRLFDPFFTTKEITGTGLGLWISREIVDRHRGLLRVRSCQGAHNHGTTFTLFLPFDAATR